MGRGLIKDEAKLVGGICNKIPLSINNLKQQQGGNHVTMITLGGSSVSTYAYYNMHFDTC